MFIESASQANGICMIMSVKNCCSTVAVASAYLIMKYKWSLKSAIDYISGIKADVFMSKSAFAQLVSIETSVQNRIHLTTKGAKLRSNWAISKDIINPIDDAFLSARTKEVYSHLDETSKKENLRSKKSKSVVFERVEEEAAIINTFLNSKNLEYREYRPEVGNVQSAHKQ